MGQSLRQGYDLVLARCNPAPTAKHVAETFGVSLRSVRRLLQQRSVRRDERSHQAVRERYSWSGRGPHRMLSPCRPDDQQSSRPLYVHLE